MKNNNPISEHFSKLGKKGGKKSWEVRKANILKKAEEQSKVAKNKTKQI